MSSFHFLVTGGARNQLVGGSNMDVTAAVAREKGAPLTVETLQLDDLRFNEARVRMVGTGICHTDATVRDGHRTPLPAVLGHEGAGVVEAVGDGVTTVEPGDHVVLAAAYCGTCQQCRSGQMAYCQNLLAQDFGGRRPDGTTALSSKDGQVVSSHFFGQSSFATYANVVENSIVKVDDDVPLEQLGPLGCGMNTGAGAVLNELHPQAGTSLAVFGAGAVGSAAVMAARVAGCTTIIALDIHDSRLTLARELGATHTINSTEADVVEELVRITGGQGVNYAVDTTALPALLTQAARALSIRGTLVLIGGSPPGTEVPFEIGASLIKGWTFKTVIQGSSVPQVFIPQLVKLWKQGRFSFDKLIKTYDLADINQGFEDSAQGLTVKPVVTF